MAAHGPKAGHLHRVLAGVRSGIYDDGIGGNESGDEPLGDFTFRFPEKAAHDGGLEPPLGVT